MNVKIRQTTWFLELQNLDWGLVKDVFSSKYLLGGGGESLVLNIRQKVKLIFFMHFFELQPGLAFI